MGNWNFRKESFISMNGIKLHIATFCNAMTNLLEYLLLQMYLNISYYAGIRLNTFSPPFLLKIIIGRSLVSSKISESPKFSWLLMGWNFCGLMSNTLISVINTSSKNTFGVKKVWPSKVESYLKINAWRDQQQQDLISDCGQGLAHWPSS